MTLSNILKNHSLKKNLSDLLIISKLLRSAVILDEEALSNYNLCYPLSKYGEKRFRQLQKKYALEKDGLVYLTFLIDLYDKECYFNLKEIQIWKIKLDVSKMITNEEIKFIWNNGRDLYDRYFDEFKEQKLSLTFVETKKLLESQLKGVFQIENIIIGPYGLMNSKQERMIRPTLELNLWHCSDPSCPTFHIAELQNDENSLLSEMLFSLSTFNNKDVTMDITDFIKKTDTEMYYNPNSQRDLIDLLANSFGLEEHKLLLKTLITDTDIRANFPKSIMKSSDSEILKKIDKSECLSLIMLETDQAIINSIEKLLELESIIIPSTEIRESHIEKAYGFYDAFLQCSTLGVRTNFRSRGMAVNKLKKLIKDVNSESPYREQLEWSLRDFDTHLGIDSALNGYLAIKTPIDAIKETIFTGRIQLENAFKNLFGHFEIPKDSASEEKLINKIAWKLGFNINIFPTYLSSLYENLSIFESDVLESNKYNELDKARIRSSGVNLFVSVEETLQHALSYITWALLSDHYLDTKFSYTYDDARNFMVETLDGFEYTNDEFLRLDKSGKNTLFPLITGFSSLSKMCDSLLSEREKYARPKSEFPQYYENAPLNFFPFEHKKLLFDIKASELKALIIEIKSVVSEFGKGKILETRNKLQHKRDDFPTQQELIKTSSSLQIIYSTLENQGIYPNVHLFEKSITDEFNRTQIVLSNYKKKQIKFYFNSALDGTLIPSVLQPTIILNNISVGNSGHPLAFKYSEKSAYQNYWKNFPRKKIIKEDKYD